MLEPTGSLVVGGQRIADRERLPVVNPARPDALVGSVALGTPADGRAAIDAAWAARQSWAARPTAERYQLIASAVTGTREDLPERAALLTQENGKVLRDATGECLSLDATVRDVGEFVGALDAVILEDAGTKIIELRRPFGVALIIVPFNWPIALATSHLVPALLAGNTVVVKPPLSCPLALIDSLARVASALPPGVLNVVPGPDETLTTSMLQDRRVAVVGFTGSVPTAVKIMNALRDVKRLVLELGGNDAAMICADAVFDDRFADQLVTGALWTSGQFCAAVKRVYVHSSRYTELCELLQARFDEQVLGDGLRDGVSLGPLISAAARERAQSLIARSRAEGARVIECGKVDDEDGFRAGYFVRPTLVLGPAQDSMVVQAEQFAPVLPILPVASDDEAVTLANDSSYGLSGSVWSASEDRAFALAARIESGSVLINGTRARTKARGVPFGGAKQSGIGRTGGTAGLLSYSEAQHNFAVRPSL
jgi:acyl-CoA reductase-like NAD-dependent aldehyde dehydrogenase